MITTDIVVIGAGPVGLFAIFECGMMRMQCHVIDALDIVGGQCAALYPEKPIFDIPGHPRINAADLIHNLEAQAAPFSPTYHLGTQVTGLERLPSGRWCVETTCGKKFDACAVIIAAGVGAFGPNRPPLTGIEQYEGTSVHYAVTKREAFRDQTVVIAGGGDSAVDWAISLSEVARAVHVVHRRSKFRAAPESVARLHALAESGAIHLEIPYQLAGLEGTGARLTSVAIEDLEGGRKVLHADALLPFFGLSMNLGPIASWGLNLDRNHILIDPSTSTTSAPGIFAIGDIATYGHKQKLILTGFAEAAQAAHAARALVYPGEVWHFEYSTTQGVPKG